MEDEKNKNPYSIALEDPLQVARTEDANGVPTTGVTPAATANPLVPKVQNAPALPEFDVNASALELNKALTEYITNLPVKTKEELERDERRERIAAGIRALGGMATAFSNLAYTGQGAPSQTLAKIDDGEARIDKWRARNDKLWNDYLGAQRLREQLMRQRIADARYEREWQNRLEQQGIANENAAKGLKLRQDELEFKKEHAHTEQERWQKTFDANQEDRKAGRALQAAGLRQQGATLAENRRHNEAMEKVYGDRVNVQRYRAGIQNGTMSSINTWNPITGAKEPMVIDWTRAADMMPQLAQEAAQAAETSSSQTLKNAYRDYRSAMMSAKGDAKKIDAANRRLIDTYLSSDSAAASSVVPVLMRAGAIEYDMSDNTMPGVGGSGLGNTIPGL